MADQPASGASSQPANGASGQPANGASGQPANGSSPAGSPAEQPGDERSFAGCHSSDRRPVPGRLASEPRPAACLFDFDGVIVDSFAMHELGWRSAFLELTGRELPDCSPEMLTGKSSQQIAEGLAALGGEPSLAPSLLARKIRMLSDGSLLPPLRPGAREAIEWCRLHRIPHGIASNAPGAYLRAALDGHDLQVPVVLGYDDVRNPKPAPDLYLLCGELAGLAASDRPQALVFEDSPPGITAAVKAGMYPIGILARLPADLLRLCGARAVYSDLAAWLAGNPVER